MAPTSLTSFFNFNITPDPNPIIACAMIQPVLPPRTILHFITDRALVRWMARVICIRISPCFKFIAKKSLGPFFPALPQSTRVPYSVTSLLHSWPRDMLATPAWAMAIPFRECSFVMLVPLRILPASLVYAYQHLLRYGTTVPTLHTMPISHFSLVFAVALGFEIMC